MIQVINKISGCLLAWQVSIGGASAVKKLLYEFCVLNNRIFLCDVNNRSNSFRFYKIC